MAEIYAAVYNDCIHESAFATISLHKTESGAELAIEKHKQEEARLAEEAGTEIQSWQMWAVFKHELFD